MYRTKVGKDLLFRKKKELQRLITDIDEDNSRLNQLKIQSMKMDNQKVIL
jgi:hypothetical protein